MKREVHPEWLDELPARDPRAARSRRDLRRLNVLMGHPRIMALTLHAAFSRRKIQRLAELGAGDGHFLLCVAHRLQHAGGSVEATLVDRLDAQDADLRGRFDRLGWRVTTEIENAETWLRREQQHDVIVSNLFLHQFDRRRLAKLMKLASKSARVFIALEPRRAAGPLLFSRLLWFIGCGAVTRHDAPVSVRAGFRERELSELWPQNGHWKLVERPVGLFSHLFVASRKE